MPDCQSGEVHSVDCGTIICIAVAGDFGVCHADCHEGNAAMPCTRWAAAVVGAPVSFREKETGAGWRSEMAKRKGAAGQLGRGMYLPQWQRSEVGIHHSVSDRASRRTLIALWGNHHGVA